MSAGKFLAGFIVGGAVGAIAGLLLAPKSGEETRAMIAKTSSEIYDKTEDSLKEITYDSPSGQILQGGMSRHMVCLRNEQNRPLCYLSFGVFPFVS